MGGASSCSSTDLCCFDREELYLLPRMCSSLLYGKSMSPSFNLYVLLGEVRSTVVTAQKDTCFRGVVFIILINPPVKRVRNYGAVLKRRQCNISTAKQSTPYKAHVLSKLAQLAYNHTVCTFSWK